ncbi:circularly permuted type 2 ATP-grasp protein [Sphingomonas quercus]|uniref:Circularly permuted type 2 ATP-grasp protein n=1 Tax=Sphingomonas quercus TaxID=2842451 RepID=A0ABS6BIB1_9SPHN|nr:circularly permuted type 2 ATP-grasp protein [Sphingomonas quercus]MBU3078046.1 circularly permuted type 2 ATP-grasp protein [Sphingomonas quercus]
MDNAAVQPALFDWVEDWVSSYASTAGSGDILRDSFARGETMWDAMLAGVAAFTNGDLANAAERVHRQARELGTAYRLPGESEERPWPLSPLPLVLGERDWRVIEAGVAQRAELHERLLDDLYGPQALVKEGLLPAAAVTGSPHFQRGMIDIDPPGGHRLYIYAADLGRGPDGEWRVLGDHLRAPTGAGYALENRLALSRVMGEHLNRLNVQRLAPFFEAFRQGMVAGCRRSEPRIALLTPGRFNQSYPEQAHLARYMGMLLVEGSDLAVHDDRLFVRTIDGLKRVDAVWRRMDSRWVDPLAFDSHSQIGVPGLMDAMAAGNAVVANMPGCGVGEARGLAAFLPRLSRRLLNVELLLPNTATWWCGQPREAAEVEAMFDRLLIAPAFETAAGLKDNRPVIGATLDADARAALIAAMRARPMDYVGQEVVRLSTMPSVIDGVMAPRPFTLRVFAARNGRGQWQVMPGGFARLGEDADVRATVMGEGVSSADVTVVAGALTEPHPAGSRLPIHIRRNPGTLQSRAADNLFWLGRYLERGEAHLRLVRAALGGTIDADGGMALAPATIDRIAEQLVASGAAAKTARAAERGSAQRDVAALAFAALDNGEESASVRALLATARGIAEGTRERLSADVWRLLDTSLPPLTQADAATMLNRATAFQERFSALAGLAAENMARTSGWRFHDLGRRLERAAETCRLARAFAGDEASVDDLATLLDICDSQISYRARYPEGIALDAVRDLILLDPWNPRSLAYQVDRIVGHLRALPSLRDDGMPEEQVAMATHVAATMAVANAASTDSEAMLGLENRLYALSDAIGARYFLQGSQIVRSTATIRLA